MESLIDINKAYLKLKHEVYYDTINLFLRDRLADFEQRNNIDEIFQTIAHLINNPNDNNSIININSWLNNISFKLLPKKITTQEEIINENPIITNVRSSDKYFIKDVTYFIDAPVELHIIDMLWCMSVGKLLDDKIDTNCLGNRILKNITKTPKEIGHSGLFKTYINQYNTWRDNAINTAEKALEGKTNILIIAMDIKQCYYNIEANWDAINDLILNEDEKLLTGILNTIHCRYHEIISKHLMISHPDISNKVCLPIGLYSSAIINNYTLLELDKIIFNNLNPLYYGRYVDDILIVIPALPSINEVTKKEDIISTILHNIFTDAEDGNKISLAISLQNNKIEIQDDKLIIQHFDYKHSTAGLKKFKKQIEEQSSEFRFLPDDDENKDLEECSFDITYKGSINKLRSVIGISENSTELSKYLSRRIIRNRLTQDSIKNEYLKQIYRFFQGRNILEFSKLWEKVFTLLIISNKDNEWIRFLKSCSEIIEKLVYRNNIDDNVILSNTLKDNLISYLHISCAISYGLKNINYDIFKNKNIRNINKDNVYKKGINFRISNLIRHHFVVFPLLNYTDYNDDLLNFENLSVVYKNYKLNIKKIKYSPRFIHFDEYQLYYYFNSLFDNIYNNNSNCLSIIDILKKDKEDDFDYFHDYYNFDADGNIQIFDQTEINENLSNICVGVANIKITDNDIEKSHSPNKKPNLSIKRQSDLYNILNESIKRNDSKCDILVLPELSIPVAWLSFMSAFARKHQIGIIFGLEHLVIDNNVHNIVVTMLPFIMKENHNGCLISMRLKNHYAPREKHELNRLHLNEISSNPPFYELFTWRGVKFSVYNCYELSDIKHRSLMRSEIDVMFSISWNKDVYYYSNILESVTRDIHCHVVHSNTSQYGDSRIIEPTKHDEMNIVYVKGGINTSLLKERLRIYDLRDFQIKNYSPEDERFKPKPAGFMDEKAWERIKMANCKNILIKKIITNNNKNNI